MCMSGGRVFWAVRTASAKVQTGVPGVFVGWQGAVYPERNAWRSDSGQEIRVDRNTGHL